jgi:hypothetical protein
MFLNMSSYPYQYVESYSTPPTPQQSSPWESQPDMFLQEQATPQTYEPHPIIQLQEQEPVLPPQHLHERHYHSQHGSEGRSECDFEDVKSQQSGQFDATRQSISPTEASTMPIRRPPTRAHVEHGSHPYRRPKNVTAPTAAADGRPTVRKPRELPRVRFADLPASPPPPPQMPVISENTRSRTWSTTRCALITKCLSDFSIRRYNYNKARLRMSERPCHQQLRHLCLKRSKRDDSPSGQMYTLTWRVRCFRQCWSCLA